jgi:hypothetical protein
MAKDVRPVRTVEGMLRAKLRFHGIASEDHGKESARE